MKLLRKTKWVIVLIMVATSLFSTGTVFATYIGAGHFATNQMYRCHVGSYATENQNASAKWSATTDLDVYYSCTGNNITTVGQNYGQNNQAGYAYICSGGWGCDNWFQQQNTYTSCEARSNTYYLGTWTSTQRQFNATHELGHCWSLYHDTRTTSVMQTGQLNVVNPDADNVTEVNNRH